MSYKKAIKQNIKKVVNSSYPLVNNLYFKSFLKEHHEEIQKRNEFKKELAGETILVLAPHVDDETIGCGGALLQYVKRGKKVHLAYLTNSGKRGLLTDGQSISGTRKKEAEQVATFLNLSLNQLHFLQGNDGDLLNTLPVETLNRLLDSIRPDVIFLPVPLDTHLDHIAVALLLLKAINHTTSAQTWQKAYPTLYLYEVQSPMTPLYSNIILDISQEAKDKAKLVKLFQSQANVSNFATILDPYNGSVNQSKAAELYIKTSLSQFENTTRKYQKQFTAQSKALVKMENQITFKKSFSSSLKLKQVLLEYHPK